MPFISAYHANVNAQPALTTFPHVNEHDSQSHIDSAKDLSIAVELKFLIPLLPRGSGGGAGGGTGRRSGGDSASSARSLGSWNSHHPPLETVDYIANPRAITDEQQERVSRETFASIADTISRVPGQDAISSYELRTKESDCWASRWVVKKSNSGRPSSEDAHHADFVWVPVEINSPKMRWKDPDTFATVRTVLRMVKMRWHLVSNYTCEVHVHVGRMDDQPFGLPAMKRIAMLSWLVEPTMRKVKDPMSPNFHHVYTWSWAARIHSRLAKQIRQQQSNGTANGTANGNGVERLSRAKSVAANYHALRLIEGTTSLVQLGRLMSGENRMHRRLGFNFSALGLEDERARANPRTIECRFLEGTVDDDVVLGWMRIFGTLVQVALDHPESEGRFAKTILRLVQEPEHESHAMAFRKLMEDLGVEEKSFLAVQMMIERIHAGSRHDEEVMG